MSNEPPARVLSYASPSLVVDPTLVDLAKMRRWRWVTLAGVIGCALAVAVNPWLVKAGWLVVIGSVVATLHYMTSAAHREMGAGYSVRQLIVAIVLTPVCLWGLIVVPRLVENEIHRQRLIESRRIKASEGLKVVEQILRDLRGEFGLRLPSLDYEFFLRTDRLDYPTLVVWLTVAGEAEVTEARTSGLKRQLAEAARSRIVLSRALGLLPGDIVVELLSRESLAGPH
jgi:hypothetical protein